MTFPSSTLVDIRQKVRNLTARPSADQITDAQIDQYVNTYYVFDMPESMKFLTLRDTFTFVTQANQDNYPFDNNTYLSCVTPCYSAGQQMDFFQDRDLFYRTWDKSNFIQQIVTGNGNAGPYAGTIPNVPILKSVNTTNSGAVPPQLGTSLDSVCNVMFSASFPSGSDMTSPYVIDDGIGNIVNPNDTTIVLGTINYLTGAFTFSFPVLIPAGIAISCSTTPFAAAQPRSILFSQNRIILRPVPDQAYIIDVGVNRVPTSLLNNNSEPQLKEWWQLLAFGAARKVLVDNGDYETLNNIQPFYEEQLLLMQRRTLTEYVNQRASTIYSDKGQYPYSNLYPYL